MLNHALMKRMSAKWTPLRLGYSNPQKAIRDHVDEEDRTVNESFTVNGTMAILVDEEDRLESQIAISGQNRKVILINESGLYSLVLRSNLPTAKQFKRWVTSEVLPSIRKHGAKKKKKKPS